MRILALLLPFVLLLGCISFSERLNETNGTGLANTTPPNTTMNETNPLQNQTQNNTNETQPPPPPPPKLYERYLAKGFNFEYPINMATQESTSGYGGIFTGTHEIGGKTGEILIVSYINTTQVYGANKEGLLQNNPTKAASDFLLQDEKSDPAGGLLQQAYEIGDISTYGLARDAYMAEAPFKIRFEGSNVTYSGYALSIYIPERSIHAKVRIVALDSDLSSGIRDNFLLSFRIE
ncbi:MAG: hypothetical protein V1861_01565 [Candidatus Micrarchaeota archaeon]